VSAPLDGVRVLDLTLGMPGAVATMLLADYGAEVIHIERPPGAGPRCEGSTRTWDRGKRRLVLDLTDHDDLACFVELARSADVVLVGMTATDAARLGVDAAAVRALNPDVIYVGLTGFGLDDTRRTPGWEPLVAAELGAMVTAPAQGRDGPVFLGHPAISYSTAFLAVIGILACLRARVRGRGGDVVDVSMLDGVLAQFAMNWWSAGDISFLSSRTRDGQLDLGRTRMLVRQYECADGGLIQVHTGAPGAFARLMKVLGIDGEMSVAHGKVEAATPLTDHDLVVLARLPEVFATRPAAAWLEEIWANEIAALPVTRPTEVFDDGQVRHNGLIRTVEDPDLGSIEVVATPIKLTRSPARRTDNPPPDSPTGRPAAQWESPGLQPAAGGAVDADSSVAPLAGVRVVELSTFFAGPYSNRFLRDLGADVVKVEATSGDPMRPLPDPFEGACRGKRSLALDLKHPDGRKVIDALVQRADVVQHNFRPGVAERLGLDDASIRAINPNVIYAHAPGYGSTGPKSGLQSFAPLHSGFVGVYWEGAGEGNRPVQVFGNEDYYNGQLNAIGTLLALVHRERTGVGQHVECAQLSSSVFVTSHWYRRHGEPLSVLPRLSHDQFGWSAGQRIYQCLDGYVCVCCVDAPQWAALCRVVLGADETIPDHEPRDEDADRLAYEMYGRTATDWCDALSAAGVPCAVVREHSWLQEFLRDPAMIAAGRATEFDHHQHGRVSAIGAIIRLAGMAPLEPVRSPRLGEHSRAVLAELGLGDAEVDTLVADGVVADGSDADDGSRRSEGAGRGTRAAEVAG